MPALVLDQTHRFLNSLGASLRPKMEEFLEIFLAVGTLNVLAFIPALQAMEFAPISLVALAHEQRRRCLRLGGSALIDVGTTVFLSLS